MAHRIVVRTGAALGVALLASLAGAAGLAPAAIATARVPAVTPTVGASVAAADDPTATDCAMTRTDDYAEAAPEQVGLDSAKLREALTYADVNGSESLKVFRHGCLVASGLKSPLLDRVPTDNWGQTKTTVALLTGIASDHGWVDVDAPIGTYLEPGLGDAAHRAVTLRHLLHAASGVRVNQVEGLNVAAHNSRFRTWLRQPVIHEPGTYYFYDQTATSAITYVLQQVIDTHRPGWDFQDFAQHDLFDNLGIPASAYFWQRDSSGTTDGYSQLFLRPLEFGRIGELVLRRGAYDDAQVISEDYMAEFLTPSPANCGYGFLTFLNSCRSGETQVDVGVPRRTELPGIPWIASAPSDMVFTDGVGTRTFVMPSLDLVVTRTGTQELDLLPSALRGDVNNTVPGRPGAAGTHQFFRLLMDAVTDMPDEVRDSIANSGPYDRDPEVGVDLTNFVDPVTSLPGTYLSLGPSAGVGCNPLGCEGEPNDGTVLLLRDITRLGPGLVGAEQRPDGSGDLPPAQER